MIATILISLALLAIVGSIIFRMTPEMAQRTIGVMRRKLQRVWRRFRLSPETSSRTSD